MVLKLLPFLFLAGCAAQSSYNIIDITDDQWIENANGNRCVEKEMIIYPDTITYLYPGCGIRRVVKPKIHPLPKPKQKLP